MKLPYLSSDINIKIPKNSFFYKLHPKNKHYKGGMTSQKLKNEFTQEMKDNYKKNKQFWEKHSNKLTNDKKNRLNAKIKSIDEKIKKAVNNFNFEEAITLRNTKQKFLFNYIDTNNDNFIIDIELLL